VVTQKKQLDRQSVSPTYSANWRDWEETVANAPIIGMLAGLFIVVIAIRFEVADIKAIVKEIRDKEPTDGKS
jgi:hypothetical protein